MNKCTARSYFLGILTCAATTPICLLNAGECPREFIKSRYQAASIDGRVSQGQHIEIKADMPDLSTLAMKKYLSDHLGIPSNRIILIAAGRILKDASNDSVNRPILRQGHYKVFPVIR